MSRELDDIYSGLQGGLESTLVLLDNPSLRATTYERLRGRRDSIQRAISAYHVLCGQLRDGKRHLTADEEAGLEPPTTCYCSATSHPPCSFCCP